MARSECKVEGSGICICQCGPRIVYLSEEGKQLSLKLEFLQLVMLMVNVR